MIRRPRGASLAAASVLVTLAVCLVGPAAADPTPPAFTYGSKEEAEALRKAQAVEWKISGQSGLILTTGNSRTTTFAAGVTSSRKANRNKFSLEAGAAYARSRIALADDADGDGAIDEDEVSTQSQTTTRSWMAKGRYDRYLTDDDALYAAAGILADEPAGKELVGNGQVGYSRQLLVAGPDHLLLAEAGYDLTYEDQITGDGVAIHSLRGFVGYTGKLSADTGLAASGEILSNMNQLDSPGGRIDSFEDNRLTGKLSLTTALRGNISFRFGFEAHYDNAPAPRPPFSLPYADGFVPLADELDTKTEASLIVNFL
jgi:hypothetical protein